MLYHQLRSKLVPYLYQKKKKVPCTIFTMITNKAIRERFGRISFLNQLTHQYFLNSVCLLNRVKDANGSLCVGMKPELRLEG